MYSVRPGYIPGFHGCDEEVALKIINQESHDLQFSTNKRDWLGEGMHFWENNDQRAYEWAIEESKKTGSRVKKPAVLGAVITLGNCLDLLDHKNLNIVRESYEYFMELCTATNSKAPENRKPASADGNDKFIRNLDCSVIQYTH